jgi:hypothetical protein
MRRNTNRVCAGRLALIALALALGGSRPAGAAPPPACESPDDQPGNVFEWLVPHANLYLPLDANSCEKFTKSAVAACHKAVSDASKCQANVLKTLSKLAKTTCAATSGNQANCASGFAGAVAEHSEYLADSTQAGHHACDEGFASEVYGTCINESP